MKKHRGVDKKLLFIAIVISSAAEAKNFGGHVSALIGESNNAGKSSVNQITEQQEVYEVGLSGNYDNTYLSASIDYTGTDNRFAEKSQRDQRYLDGESMLQLGSLNDPVDMQLKHSRRTLLDSPDGISVTDNQDEREIVSATPRVKKRIGDSNLLTGSVEISDIDFLKTDANDSKRKTAALSWNRESTTVSQINIQLQHADVEFGNFSEADYVYTAAIATYTTQLRKLSYSLAVGYNRSERNEQESFGKPTYTVNIAYSAALNSFRLTADQAITDSSYGGGNLRSVNQNPTNDGAFNVDQIQRRNAEVTWTNMFLCGRCVTSISFYQSDDDYVVLPDEIREQGGRIDFTYNFSAKSSFELMYGVSKNEFEGSLIGQDYDLNTGAVRYRYDFNSGISLNLFFEKEKRESIDARSYDEDFFGAGLSYRF